MALGLSISLNSIPGIGPALAKLDALKGDYLAVPSRVSKALDKLALVRTAMARNAAPPSAQSDALQLQQHLQQVQSEWAVSAAAWQSVDRMRQTGGLSLDLLTTAVSLATAAGYVVSNMKSIESSVAALAAKYLTPEQQRSILTAGDGAGIGTVLVLALVGAVLLGRRTGRNAPGR